MNTLSAHTRGLRLAPAVAVALLVAGLATPRQVHADPGPPTHSFAYAPSADTYVSVAEPDASFGTGTSLYVDSSSAKRSYMKFRVSGLEGRTVVGARLELTQRETSPNGSPDGGSVFATTGSAWSDAITWNSQPTIAQPALGSFGTVVAGRTYSVPLDPSTIANGRMMSYALTSSSSDSARWGSRESQTPPLLVVEVAATDGEPIDGVTQVADPGKGSSDPTYWASNHRLDVTDGGRLLTVHGRHKTGIQLAWRDPDSGWRTATRGSVSNGLLLSGTDTGDWSASIATSHDEAGVEHAWVVWGGPGTTSTAPLRMRRLSELDSPDGPVVGPTVTLPASSSLGNALPDVAFSSSDDGDVGTVLWTRRAAATRWELVVTRFSAGGGDEPEFHGTTVLYSSSSGGRFGTLTPVGSDVAAVVRGAGSTLRAYRSTATGSWSSIASSTYVSSKSRPSAVSVGNGDVLGAVESDSAAGVVTVVEFSAEGPAAVHAAFTGYTQPTIASDGQDAWLVMKRKSDGLIVSRHYSPTEGWAGADVVELGADDGSNYAWPNALRQIDGRLRFVVRGPSGGPYKNAVLAYQRPL